MFVSKDSSPEQIISVARNLVSVVQRMSDHPGTTATVLTIAVQELAAHQPNPYECLACNVHYLAEQLLKVCPDESPVKFTLRRLVDLLETEVVPL